MVWEFFSCFLVNFSWVVMCFLLSSGFRLVILLYSFDWWSVVEMVVFLEGFFFFMEMRWSFVSVIIGFLVIFLIKVFFFRSFSLVGRLVLGSVLVVLNFFYLWMMEVIVFIGIFNVVEMFLYFFLDLCFDMILFRSFMDSFLDFMVWFVFWYVLLIVGFYMDSCVFF